MRSLRRVILSNALGLVPLLLAAPVALSAQYFGRNKVQYENFDFRLLRSPHFDMHYYPEEEEPARDATRMLERWYVRQSTLLRHQFDRKPVILYASHPDFQQTNVIGESISEGTGGVTEGLRTRIVLPLTGVYADNDHVLGHELVHAFQYDIAGQPSNGGLQGMAQLPLWIVEGMAEYLSLGREDAHTAMWLRDAAYRDDLPTITQLSRDPRYFPYRYGQAMWAYVGGKWGDRVIPNIYRAALRVGLEGAFKTQIGYSTDSLSKEWHRAIRDTYLPGIEGRTPPSVAGDRVIAQKETGSMNVSPAISPDGAFVAFISRRGLFTVDLYLADARTGEIIRELASPVNSPHFDAISFISSAGTWSPDSKKFAFIVFSEGDNEIDILDVASRKVERRVRPPGVDAISHIAWSPDGAQLAFSGMAGGISDLFLYDLTSNETRRLTNDRYADLHPTWSPDGRVLAFSTDRGTGTDIEALTFSPLKIGMIDVASGAVREVPVFRGAKHINPQFAPDGRQLYFISDPDGFSDIYRLDLESGSVFRVTRLVTGVSGITYLSPALTVSQQTGRVMFTVFERAGTNIYALDADRARGEPADPQMVVSRLSTLPPLDPVDVFVTAYLRDPVGGLPPSTVVYPSLPYRSRLALDYLGQPTLGVAASSYGTALGGSIAAYFGEMLGNRTVGVGFQGYGELADFGGQLFYLDTKRRWNWAVSAGHFPYLSGFTQVREEGTGPGAVLIYEQFRQRTFLDEGAFMTQYPFSTTRRIEFRIGVTRYGYSTEVFRIVAQNGFIIDESRRDTTSPPSITFGETAIALVGDNSFNAFVSPIQGRRYRFEVAPTFGGLNFYSVLGDARRYFFMRPLTFAVRALHYGRYGGGADDRRLGPLYLGQTSFIRGYDPNSFTLRECTAITTDPCPEFNRLIGSRLAVANFELRIPLFGNEEYGLFSVPFLPTEIAPFFDVGVAWSRLTRPEFTFDRETADRVPVMSYGISSRVNLLGYAIGEIYYVVPLHREKKGAHFGFQLQPGW